MNTSPQFWLSSAALSVLLIIGCGCAEEGLQEESGDPEPVRARYVVSLTPRILYVDLVDPATVVPGQTKTFTVAVEGTCEGSLLPDDCGIWQPGWSVDPVPGEIVSASVSGISSSTTLQITIHLDVIAAQTNTEKSLVRAFNGFVNIAPLIPPPGLTVSGATRVGVVMSVLPPQPELKAQVPDRAVLKSMRGAVVFQNALSSKLLNLRNTGKTTAHIRAAYLEGPDMHLFELTPFRPVTHLHPGRYAVYNVSQVTLVEDYEPHRATVVIEYDDSSVRIPIGTRRRF